MRRLAGIGIILCALAGCQSIPSVIRIEVDGSTLEFKKKAPPAPEPPAPESNKVHAPAP
jgi:hypothetical protein